MTSVILIKTSKFHIKFRVYMYVLCIHVFQRITCSTETRCRLQLLQMARMENGLKKIILKKFAIFLTSQTVKIGKIQGHFLPQNSKIL